MIRKALYSVALVAALGFGAAQALAAPHAPAQARACVDESCDGACVARGFSWGICNPGCTCFP